VYYDKMELEVNTPSGSSSTADYEPPMKQLVGAKLCLAACGRARAATGTAALGIPGPAATAADGV